MLLEVMSTVVQELCARTVVRAESLAQLKTLEKEALASGVAILDINLGVNEPNGVDAYHWLRQNGYQGRIYFFTGHANSHPLVAQASKFGDAKMLSKPIEVDDLVKLIEGA
jgi:FixJ family two-component response regulator